MMLSVRIAVVRKDATKFHRDVQRLLQAFFWLTCCQLPQWHLTVSLGHDMEGLRNTDKFDTQE